MARIILCSSSYLGMCNRLFQTAFFIAYCKTYNLKISALFLAEFSNYFPEIKQDFFVRFASHRTWIKSKRLKASFYWLLSKVIPKVVQMSVTLPSVTFIDIGWEKEINIQDETFLKSIKTKRYVFLMGWHFKNSINIYEFHDSIKLMFKPKQAIIDKIDSNFLQYKTLGNIVVGVHIRLGDYKIFESGKYYYSIQQYLMLMHRISDLVGEKVVFIICSNETLNNEYFKSFNCFITKNDPVTDVYTLAQCDYIIGPPSTFSMWAAFYGLKPLYSATDPNYQFNLSDFKLPALNS